jgi:hypothetical protein
VSPATKLRGINAAENAPFARDRPSRLAVALSPDGRTLAFTGMKDGVVRLYLRTLAAAEATALAGTEGADGLAFSPDGTWVAFWSNHAIQKISMAGGLPGKVCDTAQPAGISWSADDRIVFATGTIKSVAATGGELNTLTKLDPGERTHNTDKARFFEVDVSAAAGTLTLSRPRLVVETHFDGATMARLSDMSADAQRFLIVREAHPPAVTAPREINFVHGWFDELRDKASSQRR